jgi:hypothetical protein
MNESIEVNINDENPESKFSKRFSGTESPKISLGNPSRNAK